MADAVDAVADADVVIGALSPRGANAGMLKKSYDRLAVQTAEAGARLVLVGGFSCLRRTRGGPRILDAEGLPGDIPAAVVAEARENLDV